MRCFTPFLWLAVVSLFPLGSAAKSIDPEVLFSNPNILTLEMSPDSEQIAGHLLDQGEFLGVFNHKTGIFDGLINFDKDYLELSGYGWVDNDTLHFRYQDTRINRTSHGFVDLSIVDGEVSFDVRYVAEHGYIVDYLPDSENEVVFAHRSDRDPSSQKLYRLTVDQLVEEDFGRRNRFRKEIDDALYYLWDASSESLISLVSANGSVEIWVLYRDAHDWRNIYRIESSVEEFLPVSMIDQSKMIVLSNKVTDTVALVEYDLDSNQFGKVLYQHERYDLDDADIVLVSAGKNDTVEQSVHIRSVTYYDHGRRSVRYFLDEDVRQNKLLSAAFPGKQVAVVSEGLKTERKVLLVSSSSDPGAYYLYDSQRKEAALIGERFTRINHSLLSESKVMTSEMEDGTLVESIFTEPRRHSNNVLLVMPHGGPVGVRDYAHFNPEVQYFVSRGFSVLQVNFRGSAGFGKRFIASGRGEWGKAIEQDISAVVNQVRADHDFRNTCSIGSSYGGYSALMLAIDQPAIYDCAVAMYGVFDIPLLFNTSNLRLHEGYLKSVEKVVGKFDEGMKVRSPFRLVDKIDVPVLLVAGKEDSVSGFEQSNRMKYVLQQSGGDVEFLAYEAVGHGNHNWVGERHQAALVNEFLVRKLGLPDQNFVEDSVRIDEAILLADSFWFGAATVKDLPRAIFHYTRAAELGSGKAMYILGQYFRRPGPHKNLELASNWYRRAMDEGFAPAPYWLARLAEDGVFDNVSDPELLQYYTRAEELGYEYAALDIARLNCLGGEGFGQNPGKCLDLLASDRESTDLEEKDDDLLKKFDRHRLSILAQIVTSPRYDRASADVVRQVLEEVYDVDTHDVSVHLEDFGNVARRRNANRVYVRSTKDRIDVNEDSRFGIEVEVEDRFVDGKEEPKVAIVVRWRFPELENEQGDRTSESSQLLFPSVGDETVVYQTMDEEWEKVPGDWAVDLLSVDGTVLASKQFTVTDSRPD
ncbi:prolyl oligopeptidase family serine peptidase [uncultured Microbulbifer sp.]|uniref:prolyl oligopeptidase family serine peptidase n=1 Tax=uncultured Microbulbifer sp. TaxID=348147 RepID=UPI0026158A7D|nr:prolyl oligopeptidase family serine peptidase [uncultured Microbulbifer sp.]